MPDAGRIDDALVGARRKGAGRMRIRSALRQARRDDDEVAPRIHRQKQLRAVGMALEQRHADRRRRRLHAVQRQRWRAGARGMRQRQPGVEAQAAPLIDRQTCKAVCANHLAKEPECPGSQRSGGQRHLRPSAAQRRSITPTSRTSGSRMMR